MNLDKLQRNMEVYIEKFEQTGTNSASANSKSNSSHRQNALSYIQQLSDPDMTEAQCYNMLKDMELGEMEDSDPVVEFVASQEEDIVFSPPQNTQLDTANRQDVLVSQDTHAPKPTQNKWGPVQPLRKSTRTDVAGKTMMEIAVETQKKKNLEIPRTSKTGIIQKNSFSVFQDPSFISVANAIGVEIHDTALDIPLVGPSSIEDLDSNPRFVNNLEVNSEQYFGDSSHPSDNVDNTSGYKDVPVEEEEEVNLDSPPGTPVNLKSMLGEFADHSVLWTKVSKYGRGKHPRKTSYS